jgi:hypothetical protein
MRIGSPPSSRRVGGSSHGARQHTTRRSALGNREKQPQMSQTTLIP